MKKILIAVPLLAFILLTGCVDFGSGMTEKDTVSINNTNKIVVESSSADIEIIPEEREDISVVLETDKRGPKLSVSDGKTVYIKAKKNTIFNFGISIYASPLLTIYIPKDYAESLDINSSSGDVKLNDLVLTKLNLDLSSGDVKGNQLVFEEGSIKSASGDLKLYTIECASLDINSSSGDLILKDFDGKLTGTSDSGDVNIHYKNLAESIDYKVSSGDLIVDLNNSEPDASFDLKCSSGNVSLNYRLDNVQFEKNNSVKGTSGNGTHMILLRASSGDITIK
ncbi:MAG: hypothetical protein CVV02_00110 [Firmicutes bacterium HGW-Firmicutes-7]|nr:MAG: hypothetical protein CVV02_00110 [Firmicutes bacterium HGW-Firmicutes-7]